MIYIAGLARLRRQQAGLKITRSTRTLYLPMDPVSMELPRALRGTSRRGISHFPQEPRALSGENPTIEIVSGMIHVPGMNVSMLSPSSALCHHGYLGGSWQRVSGLTRASRTN